MSINATGALPYVSEPTKGEKITAFLKSALPATVIAIVYLAATILPPLGATIMLCTVLGVMALGTASIAAKNITEGQQHKKLVQAMYEETQENKAWYKPWTWSIFES